MATAMKPSPSLDIKRGKLPHFPVSAMPAITFSARRALPLAVIDYAAWEQGRAQICTWQPNCLESNL